MLKEQWYEKDINSRTQRINSLEYVSCACMPNAEKCGKDSIIDWCEKEIEKRINAIRSAINQDGKTFKFCGRSNKGHKRAIMLINELMQEKK